MKIVIAGGTGFIGRHLCQTCIDNNHEVTVLSRNPEHAQRHLPKTVTVTEWNGLTWGSLDQTLDGKDALINLVGEPIADARWTPSRKQLLRSSRIDTTRLLVDSIIRVPKRPTTLINASGIGFYGPQDVRTVREGDPAGNGFLSDLCVGWEREANRAEEYGLRVLKLRIGMVLGTHGGALSKMILPFRFFLGGPILPGTQPVSWIHQEDLSRLIEWLLGQSQVSGPVNAVAPESATMNEFCRTLGKSMNRPSWLPVPGFALKLGLGELATVMTTGQHVIPQVAQQKGFTFSYPTLEQALHSIFEKSEED